MNLRILTSLVAGAIIGSSFAYALGFSFAWHMVGATLGGSIAWLTYVWRDIKRVAAQTWNGVSGWKPNGQWWFAFGSYSLASLILTTGIWSGFMLCFAALVWLFTDNLHLIPANDGVWQGISVAWMFCFLYVNCLDKVSRRAPPRYIRLVTKHRYAILPYFTPIWPFILLLEFAVLVTKKLPAGLLTFARFLLRVFVQVHSKDALDCAVYAAVGVLVAGAITHTPYAIPLAAMVGVLLALCMRGIARRIPERIYA